MTDERYRPFIFFLVAAVAGLIGGLVFAWFISPVEFTDVEPSELRPESRVTYLQLVGASFAFENDWRRAEYRIAALRDPDIGRQVGDVTERAIAEGRPAPILRALSKMSDRLGDRRAAMVAYLATPVPTFAPSPIPASPKLPTPPLAFTPTPVPTIARLDTPTPLPTFTPTSIAPPVYRFIAPERICEPGPPQIRVVIEDEKGRGVPGVEVWVTWDEGADRFVTGLKPEKGGGYGDMDIRPDTIYAVAVAPSTVPLAAGIKTEKCPSPDPAQAIWASWQFKFRPIPPTPTPTITPGPSPTPTSTVTLTPPLTATITPAPTATATREP